MRICDFMHAASISIDIIVTDSINDSLEIHIRALYRTLI
jgi:hypothetical protein